jgi:hypothetical protein
MRSLIARIKTERGRNESITRLAATEKENGLPLVVDLHLD